MSENTVKPANFIHTIIDEHLKNGRFTRVHTRFPPEPNGYLHIGHAKSITINFGTALAYNGKCNLRFDDTNPSKEEQEYVDSIKEDVRWFGYDWEDREFYASDYFDQLYEYAQTLIKKGKAYVCELTAEETRAYRGTLKSPGQNSPYRERSVEENLDLFTRMKNGEFPDGSKTLRAKIDMASGNINMRDPVLYRIQRAHHHRTGDKWCIYPMYDFAHGQSDSLEGITHSVCTLEFEDHRPLYDWFIDQLEIHHPQQIEFARLNLTYTVLSKRKLRALVEGNYVCGWDDPRMPTLSGLRRRGYSPEGIKKFCEMIGVSKSNSTVDIAMLEFAQREDLNKRARRVMAVLDPIKLIITNYPEDQQEYLDASNNPEDESMGSRKLPFSRELYIEREDFMETPSKKFHRLAPGQEVRLKFAYYITAGEVIKDAQGNITAVTCTYDPATKGGWSEDGRKVKGTIHWVSVPHAQKAEVRLYDYLFSKENPEETEEGQDFTHFLNPGSLQVSAAYVEPGLLDAKPGEYLQFERKAYFCLDKDSTPEKLVFNRTITLKDTWAKVQHKD